MTTMFLHELSLTSMDAIFREAQRVLAPGGLMLNMEQPAYAGMPPFEQAIRDWDAHYNNEPFWTTLHSLNLDDHFVDAGFERGNLVKKVFTTPAGPGGQEKISMVFVGAAR
jgi:ubiquinone/menaquinone biosynthesis C-methylase UbiE